MKTKHRTPKSGVFARQRFRVWSLVLLWGLVLGFGDSSATRGQNVIEDRATGPTASPIQIHETQVLAVVNFRFEQRQPKRSAESTRLIRKLDRHVNEFLDGWPWMPFQQTLGI